MTIEFTLSVVTRQHKYLEFLAERLSLLLLSLMEIVMTTNKQPYQQAQ
jgi:hypothetical protein